ncbi:hypothetical protein E4K72_09120 [Oxalobacteraceae bacterium OM1]|nr:hypothetical protein E4K72_09120 [Oxalobacteraceae bacterium OM1]
MRSLTAMEAACIAVLRSSEPDPRALDIYYSVCTPESVRQVVVALLEAQRASPIAQDELVELAQLVRDFSNFAKTHVPEAANPERDRLLLRARSLLSKLSI